MASSVNDNILQATGGPSVNDGLATWYGKQPTRSLPDAERGWLSQRPYTINNASLNDMWMQFLRADGYTGGLNDMLAAYWAAPSRVLPTLAGSQYGTIDTPITFTGDFEVEVEFASTHTLLKSFFGYSISGTTNYLQSGTANLTFQTPDGVVSWAHSNSHLDGKVRKVTAYRTGLTIGIKLDGAVKVSAAQAAASTVDINVLGAVGAATVITQFFHGQILSTKFTDAGTVVTNFVFDSGSTTDQPSRGSGNNVTLVNFITTDWNRYTLQRNYTYLTVTYPLAWVSSNPAVFLEVA